MNTNNKHPHFSRTVLHNGEERVKRIFRDQLAELAGLLEVGISLLVVVALMLAVVPLIKMLPGLLVRWISSSASSSSRCLPSTAPAVRWKCCCMPLPAI